MAPENVLGHGVPCRAAHLHHGLYAARSAFCKAVCSAMLARMRPPSSRAR